MSLSSLMQNALKHGCTISSYQGIRYISRPGLKIKVSRTKRLFLVEGRRETEVTEHKANTLVNSSTIDTDSKS
jgi:hypothetical protein